MLDKVRRTITEYNMLGKKDNVLVSVSGGPDSVCLLHSLYLLKGQLSIGLGIFHFDHKLRKESIKDREFVESMAEKLGLEFHLKEADTRKFCEENKLSIEDGARRLRYSAMTEIMKTAGYTKAATGHTADDQAETFLIRAIRGAGLEGLTAIPPVRDVFVRPLINVYREEILGFIDRNKLDFRLDISNRDPSFFRNKIRLKVVPVFDELYPAWKKNVVNAVKLLRDDKELIEKTATEAEKPIITPADNMIFLDIEKLINQDRAVKSRILRRSIALVKGDLKDIEQKHVEFVLSKLEEKGNFSVDIPGDVIIIREYGKLLVKREQTGIGAARIHAELAAEGKTYIPELQMVFESIITKDTMVGTEKTSAYFDKEKVALPLAVRNYMPGDRFAPLGLKGSKKVHDYLIDRKVPKRVREGLLVVHDAGGTIVWLVGHEISDKVKVTESTSEVLKISVKTKQTGEEIE